MKIRKAADPEQVFNVVTSTLQGLDLPTHFSVDSHDKAVFFWSHLDDDAGGFDECQSNLKAIWWIDSQRLEIETSHKQCTDFMWWLKGRIEFALWAVFGVGPMEDEGTGTFTPTKIETLQEYLGQVLQHRLKAAEENGINYSEEDLLMAYAHKIKLDVHHADEYDTPLRACLEAVVPDLVDRARKMDFSGQPV